MTSAQEPVFTKMISCNTTPINAFWQQARDSVFNGIKGYFMASLTLTADGIGALG